MSIKSTIIPTIFMDSDDLSTRRRDLNVDFWEYGIKLQLYNLYSAPPYETSRLVLAHLGRTNKKTVIVPSLQPGQENPGPHTQTQAVTGIESRDRRSDGRNATPFDRPQLVCSEGGYAARSVAGVPQPHAPKGTG